MRPGTSPARSGNTQGDGTPVPLLLLLVLWTGVARAHSAGGSNTTEKPDPASMAPKVKMGDLVAWGGAGYWNKGQTEVPAGDDFTAVAAGMYHCVALRADGSVTAWGDDAVGQCNVPAGQGYVAIEAGFRHSLALRGEGTLVAWGSNADGQCNVPAGSDYVAIAAGADHCLALKTDGTIVAWGNNQFGQRDVPAGIKGRAIAGGWRYSLAITAEGSLAAWGTNSSRECDVPAGTDFIRIASGDHHGIAQRADGSIIAWGLQADGRCDFPPGTELPQAFAGGGHHTLVLKSDGSLVCWGDCGSGECECPAGTDYIAIAAGTHHNVAIRAAATVPRGKKTAVEYVTVANPGNPDDIHEDFEGDTYGGVPYVYRIGRYEVTASQYCIFLNAVAADDPHGLYDPAMMEVVSGYAGCQVERRGAPGDYKYTVPADWANRPVNCVSFWDACRFANWLHHGQPTGPQDANSTEDGAYTLNGYTGSDGRRIARNPGARVWIPSADEWYKAAYHKNDGITNHYWDYPTGTDVQPSNRLIDPDPGNHANFGSYREKDYTLGPPYWRTEVGEFENSPSPYGTFDQAGNVREWTDTLAYVDGAERTQHGSSYSSNPENRADQMGRHAWGPEVGNVIVGLRVAAERLQADLGGRAGSPDGVVNLVDFSVFARSWATDPNSDLWDASCDIVQDDRIDMLDLGILAASWLAGR